MTNPEDLKYTKEHVWVKINDNQVTVGITDNAQFLLGDVVFVELPDIGNTSIANESLARIESVKAISDVIAPVGGKVIKSNTGLEASAELINEDPYGEGWIAVLEISDITELEELMSVEEYNNFLAEGEDQS
ncbi:MAG: glycine cleavage system protein GcvH [Thermincola sp.]|jgi:glycine cleavage system H protein|nr:glycine cleavage system protein GcvH [Thermincola sp.]MDT3702490.1 glycine cleavage system protein GcvH [Thermincola sp.]